MANKYVFIKAQPNDAKHWSNVTNGMNLLNVGSALHPKYADAPDQIDHFTRREMRPSVSTATAPHVKTALQFGYKAFGTLSEDVVAGIETDLMIKTLDDMNYPHAFVSFGYFFDTENTEAVPTGKIITGSVYYARDKDGHIINVKKGNKLVSNWGDGKYKFATWYTMFKITHDIYYMVINPQLANIYENIETEGDGVVYSVMDAHEGTLNDMILHPSFGKGSLHMSDNLVLATGKSFKVDPFAESPFRYRYDYDCKAIDLRVKTNLKYKTNDDGSLTFESPEAGVIGYIYLRVPVSSAIIDQSSLGVDSVRRSYIVVKG
jgi:hypothetical protein